MLSIQRIIIPFISSVAMRLKRLEIFGFKSFFDKTVLTFQEGVTGIVGPNGCGKSNIADAILWVMGEQSPKSLRGERMEDVIFSGTEQRKPLSVAEVSLTIGGIAHELPAPYTPYAELTFCRRLYRSGESDYLINKTPCRLKDIRDLLIDTGAGYRAHTIIEQGKVDTLITATPIKRREIVEEAAGIAKYRLRKAEALRKLEATERNLTRVCDIIGEIKRQRNGLDRQARKAERYQNLSERLQALECQMAFQEWTGWTEKQAQLSREEESLQLSSIEHSTKLADLERRQTELRLSITQKETLLQKSTQQVSEVEGTIQALEGKIETIHAQRKGWLEVQSRTDQEISAIKEGISSLLQERERLGKEASALALELPEKEKCLEEHESRVKTLDQAVHSENAALEKANIQLFHLASKLTTSNNNLLHFQTRMESILRQKERLQLEEERLAEKRAQSESSLDQLAIALKETADRLAKKREAQVRASDILQKTEAAIASKEKRLQSVKEDLTTFKSQIASREGFYRGLLGKQEGDENQLLALEGLEGMVADLIDVPPRYERAIEAVLEKRLNGIVVKDHQAIQKGLAHLRQAELGRGIFFPRQCRANAQKTGSVSGEGLIGSARDLVSPRSGYEAIADSLLKGVMIVTDLDAAVRLWESFQSVQSWVTLSGEVLCGSGMVTGGDQSTKGLLEQKREIQQLERRLGELQKEDASLEAGIAQDQSVLKSIQVEKAQLNEAIRSLEVDLLKIENDQTGRREEVRRLHEEGETITFEQEESLREEESLTESDLAERRLIAETEVLKKEQEEKLEQTKAGLIETRQRLDLLNEEVVKLRIVTQSLKETKRHLLEKGARLQNDQEKLQRQLQEKTVLVQSLQEKLKEGETEEAQMISSIGQFTLEREALIEAIRSEQEVHSALLSDLEQVDASSNDLRTQLVRVQSDLQEKALKKVEARMNRQKISETITEKYQIEIEHYQNAGDSASGEQALALEEAQMQAAALHKKIEEIGSVNLAAIEEYSELDQRYQFLTDQESDLRKSMEGLREVIEKINKTTRGLFVETFHTLNRKFGEIFTSFFGGGNAELVLLDPAHPLESGIEMVAQPPGKGKRNMMLFSGGEKALTAISLLFATFLIHPTPFCLLDEIDAPLDEENTRRFTEVLLEMSKQTQFIIVTHNKFTMEIANVLYGVTMEETGLSKLVSVNLKTASPSNGKPERHAATPALAEKT